MIGRIDEKRWSAVITYRGASVRLMSGSSPFGEHARRRSQNMNAGDFDKNFDDGV